MFDVIIIGGGASGLMCSNIINKEFKVVILEKNKSCGKKLLITGNGRCNLTNNKDKETFLENLYHNKKYLYSTIYKFGPKEIMNHLNLVYKEKTDNKIFPKSNNAHEVLNKLLTLNSFPIYYENTVQNIKKVDDIYIVQTNKKEYKANNVVIATGGCSFPKLGSSGDHYLWARDLNIKTIEPYPVETGVTLEKSLGLEGIQFDNVNIKTSKREKNGTLMFTHKGITGEAIMFLSEFIYLNKDKYIKVDFLPQLSITDLEKDLLVNKEKEIYTYLKRYFSKRFSTYLLTKLNIDSKVYIKQINKTVLKQLMQDIKNHTLNILKVGDIKNAYATGGGINLNDINTSSFECKKHKGLYFIGEALDIHGPIGGYNLTLAFSTAYSCADNINKTIL